MQDTRSKKGLASAAANQPYQANITARMKFGAPLPYNDVARNAMLAAIQLDTKPF